MAQPVGWDPDRSLARLVLLYAKQGVALSRCSVAADDHGRAQRGERDERPEQELPPADLNRVLAR
jgi:hypothetical protein